MPCVDVALMALTKRIPKKCPRRKLGQRFNTFEGKKNS
jgi:hypothetical protein